MLHCLHTAGVVGFEQTLYTGDEGTTIEVCIALFNRTDLSPSVDLVIEVDIFVTSGTATEGEYLHCVGIVQSLLAQNVKNSYSHLLKTIVSTCTLPEVAICIGAASTSKLLTSYY